MQLEQVVWSARAQARIAEILAFQSLGGGPEICIEKIIFPSDWDNSTQLDLARIARIPDTIFLTIHARAYGIKNDEWLDYMLKGNTLERIMSRKRRK